MTQNFILGGVWIVFKLAFLISVISWLSGSSFSPTICNDIQTEFVCPIGKDNGNRYKIWFLWYNAKGTISIVPVRNARALLSDFNARETTKEVPNIGTYAIWCSLISSFLEVWLIGNSTFEPYVSGYWLLAALSGHFRSNRASLDRQLCLPVSYGFSWLRPSLFHCAENANKQLTLLL